MILLQNQLNQIKKASFEKDLFSYNNKNQVINSFIHFQPNKIVKYGWTEVKDIEEKARQQHEQLVQKILNSNIPKKDYLSIFQYRWTQSDQRKLEIIIACIGIHACTAKQIQHYSQTGLQLQKYQSHKDIYWKRVRMSYNLENDSLKLQNWMYDKKSKNAKILQRICNNWLDCNFKGYTEEEIYNLLYTNQSSNLSSTQ